MVQRFKQCAGCGAQMGARSRVCPRCGRGSLFELLGQLFVLGVLLLAIGIVSGLIPLAPIEQAVIGAAADTVQVLRPARPPVPKAAVRPRALRPGVRGTEAVAVAATADSQSFDEAIALLVASAPCPVPDTELIRRQLEKPGWVDDAGLAALACSQGYRQQPETAQVAAPEAVLPLPDTVAEWSADSPTVEPPVF